MIDREGLADFLRRRREALQPEDVGLPRGHRRRTSGLRREEVAADLQVHAQTVRYRMSQLRDLYGDQLRDPQIVRAMIIALPRNEPHPT